MLLNNRRKGKVSFFIFLLWSDFLLYANILISPEILEYDVFAISTEGSSDFSITFNYSDLSSTTTASVSAPDWFDEITETTSRYYLVNNLDRFNLNNNTLDNVNDPAIFGFSFTPDSARTLSSITVNPTSQFFTFFGSTGNQIPTQTATPEPASTLAILGLGLGTLVAKARKLG